MAATSGCHYSSRLLSEQETQCIRKTLCPLALAMSCALGDSHQQAAIVEAGKPQVALEFADVVHNLFVFIFSPCFSRANRQKTLVRPLPDKTAVLQDSPIRNKQGWAFQQQAPEHCRPIDDRVQRNARAQGRPAPAGILSTFRDA